MQGQTIQKVGCENLDAANLILGGDDHGDQILCWNCWSGYWEIVFGTEMGERRDGLFGMDSWPRLALSSSKTPEDIATLILRRRPLSATL